ncbi:MAG: hypothetical protein CSB44_00050 [Gammaproteobacteria bacterium]|nr:MAG: hypothetical protein CSB44_00050 [Gammaproteobacteria bacterium]
MLLLLAGTGSATAEQVLPLHARALPAAPTRVLGELSIIASGGNSSVQDGAVTSANASLYVAPFRGRRGFQFRIGAGQNERLFDLLPTSADVHAKTDDLEAGFRIALEKSILGHELSADIALQRSDYDVRDTLTLASQAVNIDFTRDSYRFALVGDRAHTGRYGLWYSVLGAGLRVQIDDLDTQIDAVSDARFKGDDSVHPWLQAGLVRPLGQFELHAGAEWSDDLLLGLGIRLNLGRVYR